MSDVTPADVEEFLEHCQREVDKWPDWKKKALANFAPKPKGVKVQKYTVELVYESYDDENWYCTVEVEASSPEEAGKKAKAMSPSLTFYQVTHGPPEECVSVDTIYTKTKIQ